MKIDLIATTHAGYVADKSEFDTFSGHVAGICYMPHDFDSLLNEDAEKTQKRIANTKLSGHHSVCDHEEISLYIEDIPKALAMVLNNEKMYTTSEKSARYTKMVLDADTQKLYDKWLEIFTKEITDRYNGKYPDFFKGSKITKLAQENARYLISVFTPTSMVYSTTYRQINYLYAFFQKEIENPNSNTFYQSLKPAMIDFCKAIENSVPYLDEGLMRDGKNRSLSLYNNQNVEEYFGDVYATTYQGSFAQLAQAQRHRTLSYSMKLLDENKFYLPPIIAENEELTAEWISDCNSVATIFPQGLYVGITEMGTFDNFVLKMMERKCSFAQLEINQQTNETLKKYVAQLQERGHVRAQEMARYTRGSRCTFPNYNCSSPCGFAEGVVEERKI